MDKWELSRDAEATGQAILEKCTRRRSGQISKVAIERWRRLQPSSAARALIDNRRSPKLGRVHRRPGGALWLVRLRRRISLTGTSTRGGGLRMGLRDWWDSWFEPPAPDRYANRPTEFRQHRCPLPRPRSSGTRCVCRDCHCPWMVQSGYTVTAERVVMCDPQRPWLGTTREPVTYWNKKLNWQFDWATYSGRRSSLD